MRKATIILFSILATLFAFISCNNSIRVPSVKSVSLNKTSTTVFVGSAETLTATVFPSDAGNKKVSWSSNNTSVATVDANGKVTGVAAGSATITVKTEDGNKTATCTVTVIGSEDIPLTIEFFGTGSGKLWIEKTGEPGDVYYSLNNGETKTLVPESEGEAISVAAGTPISLYRSLECECFGESFTIECDKDCYVYGNVMSLIYSDAFATHAEKDNVKYQYALAYLFCYNTHITNHPTKDLVLPATTLTYECYIGMFQGCTGLVTAPALPAQALDEMCYRNMFQDCTSLTTAPALPAETLSLECYASMFYGCTSLTTAPALPAETMVDSCYWNMFNGCTSLATAPALPAEILDIACYVGMFQDCTSLTTAPALPAETMVIGCYTHMFYGCTSLTAAPVLPATTLAERCYVSMFQGCSSLNSITCLATDISATNCVQDWLQGTAATGTFYRSTSVSDGFWSGKVNGWTIQPYAAP